MGCKMKSIIDKGLLFEKTGKQLDISPAMYNSAAERYTAVAEYLTESDPEVFRGKPRLKFGK